MVLLRDRFGGAAHIYLALGRDGERTGSFLCVVSCFFFVSAAHERLRLGLK